MESKLSMVFIEQVTLAADQTSDNTDKKVVGKAVLELFIPQNK